MGNNHYPDINYNSSHYPFTEKIKNPKNPNDQTNNNNHRPLPDFHDILRSQTLILFILSSLPVVERITTLTDQDPTDNLTGRMRCWKGAILQIKDLTWDASIYPRTTKSRQTVNTWISDIRARQKTNRNSTIIRLSLLGWTQEKIAETMIMTQGRVAQIINKANFCEINNLLDQGHTMEYIAAHFQIKVFSRIFSPWPIKTPSQPQPWLF